MARAKHTARAEARRRHRQMAAEATAAERGELEAPDEDPEDAESRPSGRSRQPARAEKRDPNARLGFGAAFRE
ncbi:MAG TPA: hypothetical protein VK831_05630, partial [Candidatus Deferrimicrobiaceae bacterium]|nr:hypothetical protein [Candidatus Deferrimicrobiaceae bacterium]